MLITEREFLAQRRAAARRKCLLELAAGVVCWLVILGLIAFGI